MTGKTQAPIAALSDDLTGTLGLAMLIANENIPVRALSLGASLDLRSGEAVVINTKTRSLPQAEAHRRVSLAVEGLSEDTIIAKRFDTTLRGHLGTELAAIMEHRPQAAAVIVPSYPASGRLCIGGYQQINGIPIERTEAAADSHWPITHSYVPDYFREAAGLQNNNSPWHVPLKDLANGQEWLTARFQELLKPGVVLVVDAYSDSDISLIAQASLSSSIPLIFVSPGLFISSALGLIRGQKRHRISVVVNGSTTAQTHQQVAMLERKYKVDYLPIPLSSITEDRPEEPKNPRFSHSKDMGSQEFAEKPPPPEAVQDGLSRFLKDYFDAWNPEEAEIIVIRSEGDRLVEGAQAAIVRSLALAAHAVFQRLDYHISGLILSGGETAEAVLRQIGVHSIRPRLEFGSLIMGGVLLDGPLAKTKVVTKGGLVGDPSILLRTITWFLKEEE